jgi:hypothetical protein
MARALNMALRFVFPVILATLTMAIFALLIHAPALLLPVEYTAQNAMAW